MTKGPAYLLKIGSPHPINGIQYATVAGLRQTALTIENRRRTITGTGCFVGLSAKGDVEALALSGEPADFELSFESGEKIRERFIVSRLDNAGRFFDEDGWTITLSSAAITKATESERG